MAAQLIADMTCPWNAEDYADQFSAAIHELVNRKVKAGETQTVRPADEVPADAGLSNVVDLTELLAQSLAKRKPAPPAKSAARTTRKRA